MRSVVSSSEIAHLWAHQAQPEARNSRRSFFFRGSTIYSYGSHFPIARHVTNKRGQAGILFTLATHSKTTSGHCDDVRRALRGHPATVLYMPEVPTERYGEAWDIGLKRFTKWIAIAQEKCFGPTGRFRPKSWTALETLVRQGNTFAEFFGKRQRFVLPDNAGHLREAIAKQQATDARSFKRAIAAEVKRQAERNAALAGNLEAWRNGENVSYRDLPRDPVALRIRNDAVETSLGADVPIDHARLGLLFVRKCRDTHTPYQRNSHTLHLGHYAIDAIDEHGNLTAGCHDIAIEEIERIAPLLEA